MVTTPSLTTPTSSLIMSQPNDLISPSQLAAMLGVKWTRPRRLRIIGQMRDAGVRVYKSGRAILVSRADVLAYLAKIKSGEIDKPDWYDDIKNM